MWTTAHRRARLVARHHLHGDAGSVVDAARSVVVLHATDPATVYLSVLARCREVTLKDIAHVMYDERALVRMLAMRRTLFVVPQELVPVVHHAASLAVAAAQRKRLLQTLRQYATEPELPDDLATWLRDVERSVEKALTKRGTATANQLSTDEPRLRTLLVPDSGKTWDVRRTITTQVLVLMAAEGRMVRCEPRGSWTSRAHTWEPGSAWWPGGIPSVPTAEARMRLVEQYVRRFGPVTETDVAWWTGWTLGTTRAAMKALDLVDVGCGVVMADDTDPERASRPRAALLPALDPTPMGWKARDWFLPEQWQPLYDRNGNIGPTIWWGGEVIGAWSVRPDGAVVTRILVDRGKAAADAVAKAAATLQPRLEGAACTPSFPTPVEKELRTQTT